MAIKAAPKAKIYYGLSTDTKPTGVNLGSEYHTTDNNKVFKYALSSTSATVFTYIWKEITFA